MTKRCGAVDTVDYTYQLGPDEPISEAIARVVAAASDRERRESAVVGPDDTGTVPPLYAVVDPDALDELFAPTTKFPRPRGAVSFPFANYQVTIDAAGIITVSEG